MDAGLLRLPLPVQATVRDTYSSAPSPSALQVKLPLDVGTQVECRFRDGQFRLAKVIERRPRTDVNSGEYEYYVHYDKRTTLAPSR